MPKNSTFKPVSRARSSKNLRWNAKERFSMGHDYHCKSLISHKMPERRPPQPPRGVRVYRSDNFALSLEDRILSDAKYMLSVGRAASIEEAIEVVIAAQNL